MVFILGQPRLFIKPNYSARPSLPRRFTLLIIIALVAKKRKKVKSLRRYFNAHMYVNVRTNTTYAN